MAAALVQRLFARLPQPIRNIGNRYAQISTQNPHLTAAFSSGIVLCVADVTAQRLTAAIVSPDKDKDNESKKSSGVSVPEWWDHQRTLSLSVFGFFLLWWSVQVAVFDV